MRPAARGRWSAREGLAEHGDLDDAADTTPNAAQLSGRAALHVPVLPEEVVRCLDPRPGGRTVDATVGAGGHAALVLERSGPDGLLLGLDRDPSALATARDALAGYGTRVRLVHGSFRDVAALACAHGFTAVDGLLADLGVSSMELDVAQRGFSFRLDGPLDMRMDPQRGETAESLLMRLDETELASILRTYGEERLARPIARRIVATRATAPLATTHQLAELVRECYRRARCFERIDPATRTFQALRIAVNEELDALRDLLAALPRLLRRGGRAVIVSFHSLEDRAVKHTFREWARTCTCPPEALRCTCSRQPRARLITPRAVRPGEAEIAANPRARSARLRAIEWLVDEPLATGAA